MSRDALITRFMDSVNTYTVAGVKVEPEPLTIESLRKARALLGPIPKRPPGIMSYWEFNSDIVYDSPSSEIVTNTAVDV